MRDGLEAVGDGTGQETGERCVDVALSVAVLAVGVEAQRVHEVELVLGAGHGDVEQAPLLLDLLRRARWPCRRGCSRPPRACTKTASHSWPLAEWMVDRIRKSSSRCGGPARSPLADGGSMRDLRQEPLPGGVPRCDQLDLLEVAEPHHRRVVEALEVRLVPAPRFAHLAGQSPSCPHEALMQRHKPGQSSRAARRRVDAGAREPPLT